MSVAILNQFTRLSPYERELLFNSLLKEEAALTEEILERERRKRKINFDQLALMKAGLP